MRRCCIVVLTGLVLWTVAVHPAEPPDGKKRQPAPSTAAAESALDGTLNLPDVQPDTQVQMVLQKLDETHRKLASLSAEVTQVKRSSLLAEPVVSPGTLHYLAPDQLRWDYREPDPMTLCIAEGTMTMYYPDLKRADVVDVRRYQGQLFQVMGIGQSSKALTKHYRIEYVGRFEPLRAESRSFLPEDLEMVAGAKVPEEDLTVIRMTPRRKRLRRRVERMRLWISERTWQPVMWSMEEPGGDSTLVVIRRFEINPQTEPGLFQLELPADVQISRRMPGQKAEHGDDP